jgi:hypothetical protein
VRAAAIAGSAALFLKPRKPRPCRECRVRSNSWFSSFVPETVISQVRSVCRLSCSNSWFSSFVPETVRPARRGTRPSSRSNSWFSSFVPETWGIPRSTRPSRRSNSWFSSFVPETLPPCGTVPAHPPRSNSWFSSFVPETPGVLRSFPNDTGAAIAGSAALVPERRRKSVIMAVAAIFHVAEYARPGVKAPEVRHHGSGGNSWSNSFVFGRTGQLDLAKMVA